MSYLQILALLGAIIVVNQTAYAWSKNLVGQRFANDKNTASVMAINACNEQKNIYKDSCAKGDFSAQGCATAICIAVGRMFECTSRGVVTCVGESQEPRPRQDPGDSPKPEPDPFNPADDSEDAVDKLPANQLVLAKCYIFQTTDREQLRKIIVLNDAHGRYYSADLAYTVRQKILVFAEKNEALTPIEITRELPAIRGFGDGGSGRAEPVLSLLVKFVDARRGHMCRDH